MDTKRNTGKETKKMVKNEMDLRFDARSENEAFARVAVAGFVSVLNPTLEELSDIKTAVSEAVTNAIIHGYEIYGVEEEELLAEKITEGLAVMPQVFLHGRIEGDVLELLIRDEGCGIADIEQAMNRFIRQSRIWTGQEWAFPLWRRLWMTWRWSRYLDRVPRYI